jgi:rhodanese-related sulfurtransferase
VAEAAKKRDAGAFILDVRTLEEWNEYHVPGSTLIPLNQLSSRVAEVPKDKEVVVVCRSGNRSATGRDVLLKAGYPQVTSLAGGLKSWRDAGKPVE